MIIMMMMSAFYSRTTYKTYVIIVLGDLNSPQIDMSLIQDNFNLYELRHKIYNYSKKV
jgi:23S rRNA-/tRNA-specific pseudouridylate synthase